MRKYRNDAGSELRRDYGIELMEGLRFFEQTAALADGFAGQNDSLEQAWKARLEAERALLAHRAKVRFADFNWDQTLRSCSAAVEIADGGMRGALHRAIN